MLTILEILHGWEARSFEEQALRCSLLRSWIEQFVNCDPDYHSELSNKETTWLNLRDSILKIGTKSPSKFNKDILKNLRETEALIRGELNALMAKSELSTLKFE